MSMKFSTSQSHALEHPVEKRLTMGSVDSSSVFA